MPRLLDRRRATDAADLAVDLVHRGMTGGSNEHPRGLRMTFHGLSVQGDEDEEQEFGQYAMKALAG